MPTSTTKQNKFLITIAGPTAVGKTALALNIAQNWKADIFSADSRQVYRLMDIGTAKPSPSELLLVKHHFINHIDIDSPYSVGDYELEMRSMLSNYFINNDVGILVGGTGLYLKAIMDGIDQFPDIPIHVGEKFEKIFFEEGLTSIQKILYLYDRDYYEKVDLNNARRILRALEVTEFTGKPYSEFLGKRKANENKPYNELNILLHEDREILYDRINRRVDNMILSGLEEEVVSLANYRHCQALETVGYKEIFQYLDGSISRETSIDLIKQNTRRYAKRQITWFKKYGTWEEFNAKDEDKILSRVNTVIS